MKKLINFVSSTLSKTECDAEGQLAVYMHLQQAASILMDQQIRSERKNKEQENKFALNPSNLVVRPQVCYRLTYQSKLKIPQGSSVVEVIIPIINFATQNNQKLKIGGMLFCDVIDGNIIQVLEGDKTEVQGLIQKIMNDPRHTDMEILNEETAREKRYQSWGMQFAQTAEDWVTVTEIIKKQRHKEGLSRAKGFPSFQDLDENKEEPLSTLGSGQGLAGLGEQKLKTDEARS